MIQKFSKSIIAYLLWIILLLLGIFLFILTRNLILGLLGTYYVTESIVTIWRVRFLDPAASVILGLLWLILMVWSEHQLRRSVRRGELMPQFARFAGPLMILLFIVDFSLFLLQTTKFLDIWRIVILAFWLIGGVSLTIYGQRFKKRGVSFDDTEGFG